MEISRNGLISAKWGRFRNLDHESGLFPACDRKFIRHALGKELHLPRGVKAPSCVAWGCTSSATELRPHGNESENPGQCRRGASFNPTEQLEGDCFLSGSRSPHRAALGKVEGLPVHRLTHRARASVYAFSGELDAWMSVQPGGSAGPHIMFYEQNRYVFRPLITVALALSGCKGGSSLSSGAGSELVLNPQLNHPYTFVMALKTSGGSMDMSLNMTVAEGSTAKPLGLPR